VGNIQQIPTCKNGLIFLTVSLFVFITTSCGINDPLKPLAPKLSLPSIHLDFGFSSTVDSFQISNTGGAGLSWEISHYESWISSASPSAGEGNATIRVSIDRAGLLAGVYTGELFVDSNGGNDTVAVRMVVSDAILEVSPTSLDFGESLTTEQFNITPSGEGLLQWQASSLTSWLSVQPPVDGTGPSTVTIGADRDHLSGGLNYGIIKVTSNGGDKIVNAKITGTLALNANFNSDAVDAPPSMSPAGPPLGDSLWYSQDLAWMINVRRSVGNMRDWPVEIVRPEGQNQGPVLVFRPSGGSGCSRVIVSWFSLAEINPTYLIVHALGASNGYVREICHIRYSSSGVLKWDSDIVPITYIPNVYQQFKYTIDFDNQTASLAIDGVPVPGAQNTPFLETTSFLESIMFSTAFAPEEAWAIDNVKVEVYDCE